MNMQINEYITISCRNGDWEVQMTKDVTQVKFKGHSSFTFATYSAVSIIEMIQNAKLSLVECHSKLNQMSIEESEKALGLNTCTHK